MRHLILGATGTIGSALEAHCNQLQVPTLGTYYTRGRADQVACDLRDETMVETVLQDYEPEAILVCAGPHDEAWAERYPQETHRIIVEGMRAVVRQARRLGSRVVMFSSPAVFGNQRGSCGETQPCRPSNVLGQAQAIAEAELQQQLPQKHLILRTEWVYGASLRSRCRVGLWRRHLARGESIRASILREGQPTFAPDLAELTTECLKQQATGILHISGPDRHSEFTWARQLVHLLGTDVDRVIGDPVPVLNHARLDRQTLRERFGPKAIRYTADGLRAAIRNPVEIPSLARQAA